MKKALKLLLSLILVCVASMSLLTGCGDENFNTKENFEKAKRNTNNYTLVVKTYEEDAVGEDCLTTTLSIDGTKGKLAYNSKIEYFDETTMATTIEQALADYVGYVHLFYNLNFEDLSVKDGWLVVKDSYIDNIDVYDVVIQSAKIKLGEGKIQSANIKGISEGYSIRIEYSFSNFGKTSVTFPKLVEAFLKIKNLSNRSLCCWIGSDFSYIEFDSNILDYDDYMVSGCATVLRKLNEALGLPSYVYQLMLETSYSMGRQTETVNGIKASWTYHPDRGLEVLYVLAE